MKVVNPGQSESDIRANAFVYDYADVPSSHAYHDSIVNVTRAQVSAGCGGDNFCPDSSLTRAQMAVFLLKAKHGFGYPPPLATGGFFSDVHAGDFAADWIEELYIEGVTSGCSGTPPANCSPQGNPTAQYCPGDPILRQQMAVFLLKSALPSGYAPPACTPPGSLSDVPCPATPQSPYSDWIYDAVGRGFMSGCGGGAFCPQVAVKRKEMAQHISATFSTVY